MPREQLPRWIRNQEVVWELPFKASGARRVSRRHEKITEAALHELIRVSGIDGTLVQLPEGIVRRQIKDRETHEGRQQWHRFARAPIKRLEHFRQQHLLPVRANLE